MQAVAKRSGSLQLERLSGDRRQDFAQHAALIRQFGKEGALLEGKRLHSEIIANGWGHVTYLGNLLVEMYGKCARVADAMSVFNGMQKPNIVSWTLIITADFQNGFLLEAMELFRRMLLEGVKPDVVAWVAVLNVCAGLQELARSKEIHALVDEAGFSSGSVVGNALINSYSRCGEIASAERVFANIRETDVISWTSMIAAYSQKGLHRKSATCLSKMDLDGVKLNHVTFISLLDASSTTQDLAYGKLVHARLDASGFSFNVTVNNSLIHMYSKCGDLESAFDIFQRIPDWTTVSWTVMLTALAQNGRSGEALGLFQRMNLEGVKADVVTLVTVVEACANQMVLSQAREIHARVESIGHLDSNVPLGNAVVNMFGKCGSLEEARAAFGRMKARNAITWSSLIGIHAQNGDGKLALEFFRLMILDGLCPNESTYASVLFACSHEGGVACCRDYFVSMGSDYGVVTTLDHYAGLVDGFGRAGMLDKAAEVIDAMKIEPDSVIWMMFLSACCIHESLNHGRVAAGRVIELDPANEAPYILLSNIYAALEMWDEARLVREIMELRLMPPLVGS